MIKKIIGYGVLAAFMAVTVYHTTFAADPVVSRTEYVGYDVWKVTAAFSENGSGSLGAIDGWVFMATVNHDDGTPCADNMDITVTDTDGVDILGGSMVNLVPSANDTLQVAPAMKFSASAAADVAGARFVYGDATVVFTETATANCVGDFFLYFAR